MFTLGYYKRDIDYSSYILYGTNNSAPSESIYLNSNFATIDWGDGTTTKCTTPSTYSHVYSSAGTYYNIVISGVNVGDFSHTNTNDAHVWPLRIGKTKSCNKNFYGFEYVHFTDNSVSNEISSLMSGLTISDSVTGCTNLFENCTYIGYSSDTESMWNKINFSKNTKTLKGMFISSFIYNSTLFSDNYSFPSGLTDVSNMFAYAKFTQATNISFVSNILDKFAEVPITNMNCTFMGTHVPNKNQFGTTINLPSTLNTAVSAFYNTTIYPSATVIIPSNAIDISYMFGSDKTGSDSMSSYISINNIDFGQATKLTNIDGLFCNRRFSNTTLSTNIIDFPSSVTGASYLFANLYSVNTNSNFNLSATNFKNCSHMFDGTSLGKSLSTVVLPETAENISYMYANMPSLNTLTSTSMNLSSYTNLTNCAGLFYNSNSNNTTITLSTGCTLPTGVLDTSYMFACDTSYNFIMGATAKNVKLPKSMVILPNSIQDCSHMFENRILQFNNDTSINEFKLPVSASNYSYMLRSGAPQPKIPESMFPSNGFQSNANLQYMFEQLSGYSSDGLTEVAASAMAVATDTINTLLFANVSNENMTGCFKYQTKLTNYNELPLIWKD